MCLFGNVVILEGSLHNLFFVNSLTRDFHYLYYCLAAIILRCTRDPKKREREIEILSFLFRNPVTELNETGRKQ